MLNALLQYSSRRKFKLSFSWSQTCHSPTQYSRLQNAHFKTFESTMCSITIPVLLCRAALIDALISQYCNVKSWIYACVNDGLLLRSVKFGLDMYFQRDPFITTTFHQQCTSSITTGWPVIVSFTLQMQVSFISKTTLSEP